MDLSDRGVVPESFANSNDLSFLGDLVGDASTFFTSSSKFVLAAGKDVRRVEDCPCTLPPCAELGVLSGERIWLSGVIPL